jgi:polyphenol oxidase
LVKHVSTLLMTSELLAQHPVTCVFTGKPVSFGGPGQPADAIGSQRLALARQLGFATGFRMPHQVHGDRIALVTDADLAETDAVIVQQAGQPVALQFADCVPVVLYCPTQHVGAVIHAGWKGTAKAIVPKTLNAMAQRFGVQPAEVVAVIGPAIGGCCFEVGPEVPEALATTLVDRVLPDNCLNGLGVHNNPKVDLKQVNMTQLLQQGVTRIEVLAACTRCNDDTLWSYRRGENGRQLAVLCLT